MAALIPSLSLRPCCLNCGATGSTKLASASRLMCRNTSTYGLGGTEKIRKIVHGEIERCLLRISICNQNLKMCALPPTYSDQPGKALSTSTQVGEFEKKSTFLFRTDLGGQVKVYVGNRNMRHEVFIEVSSLQLPRGSNNLALSWDTSRSGSSSIPHMDLQNSVQFTASITSETPFSQKSFGRYVANLALETKETPFYLSFLLRSSSDDGLRSSEIRTHRKMYFCVPVGFGSGRPDPLGLSFSSDGSMNFAIYSRNAGRVALCLFDDITSEKPSLEIDLDSYVNKSGDIWHASLESASTFMYYGYRLKGEHFHGETDNIHLDPYAKVVGNPFLSHCGSGLPSKYLGRVGKVPVFDWSGVTRPHLPMEKLVVYRLNVKQFTEDKSSQLPLEVSGTFSGVTEKLNHLKDLGVNAVLLEPIFTFDTERGPYFPVHFFSPANIYGPSGDSIAAINSMKKMVKKLHSNGIGVLLEVVFTHTSDLGALKGLDDSSYYYNGGDAHTGTRNALNCNYPIVQQMILDSLRYWVVEFHVDGFCFVNASSLLKGFHGEHLSRPPLIETISFDPLLSKVKIIADRWDLYHVEAKETRFPHWKRWAEVNTEFCKDVRTVLRGDGLISNLATRLCGSGDIFSDGRGPAFSFNFITRTPGLSLVDLVSFSGGKLASELSWNCGEEGPTDKTAVLERRLKQIRNFLFVLYVSLGVPILEMGDEWGRSSGGSTGYGARECFDWNAVKTGFAVQITRFISFLVSLRRRRGDFFERREFLKEESIGWHGPEQTAPRWEDPANKFLAMRLKVDRGEGNVTSLAEGDLFLAFNVADRAELVTLPPPPPGMLWLRLVDTALPYPGFFSVEGEPVLEHVEGLVAYEMESYSCTLFESKVVRG